MPRRKVFVMKHFRNEFCLAHEEFMRRFHQDEDVPNLRDETLAKTVWCDPDELKYSESPVTRHHTDAEIDLFQKTIYHYTGALPIVIDDEMNIIAGQGRVEAGRLLHIERIPALVMSTLNSDDVHHYLGIIEEFGNYVGWSPDMLRIDLQLLSRIILKQPG